MTIAKGGLRLVYRRKVETISIILLIFVSIMSYGSLVILAENMSDHAYKQFRAVIGDVAVFGVFPLDFVDTVREEAGVDTVKSYKVWFGDIEINGSKYAVSLTDERYVEPLTVFDLNGSMPMDTGEAVFYYALTGPSPGGEKLLEIGDRVEIFAVSPDGRQVNTTVEIVGVARGFAHLGGMSHALILDKEFIDQLVGDRAIVIGVYVDPDSDIDLDRLAERLEALVDENGYRHFFTLVNKKETNPVVVLLESASTILTIPISIVIGLIPLLVASAGSTLVIREVKIVATLKSMGMSRAGIFKYYSLPWIVRGLIGTLLGVAFAPMAAEYIYVNFIVRDSEIAEILISTLGFYAGEDVIASITLIVMGMVGLGALIPFAIASSVNIVRSISTTGLYSVRTPIRLRLLRTSINIGVRDLFSRPWKFVGVLLSIVILWGAVAALNMEAYGLHGIIENYRGDIPFDTNLFVSTTSGIVLDDLPSIVEEAVASNDNVIGYYLIARETILDVFGQVEVSQIVTGLAGDPSVAFPLEKGRYPRGLGEAVISRSLALLKGVDVGDYLEVSIDGDIYRLEVVGISISRLNNGYYLLVTPEQHILMTDTPEEELGRRSLVAYLDVSGDPEEVSEEVKEAIEENPLVSVDYVTKEEIIDNIQFMMNFILGLNTGIVFALLIASLISLSSIYSVDSEARNKELAIMKSLGMGNGLIAGLSALQLVVILPIAAPLALGVGILLSDLISRSGATAIGYVEPLRPIASLFSENILIVFLLVLGVVYLVNYLKARRLDVVRVIQEI